MRALTESEMDVLLIAVLALLVISAMIGWFPYLGQIFPSLMSGMFRAMDIIKDKVDVLKWI